MQGREKVDSSETTTPSFTFVAQTMKTSLRRVESFNLSHNPFKSVQKRPRYGVTRAQLVSHEFSACFSYFRRRYMHS